MTVLGGQRARAAHDEEELIPGIPDEITLNKVATKLAWRDIHKLLLVSRGWLLAIQNRRVYDARVRSNSRDILLMFSDSPAENVLGITLVSHGNNGPCCRYDLPPISSEYFDSIVDPSDRSVALDGKVYVFGGLDCKVHVFDVAGHGRWKQCASVLKRREEFGSGVIDGKIYVFGGAVNHESTSGSEVYNPKDNTWSQIRPIVSLRCGQHIGRVPDKFLVCGEQFYNSETVPNRRDILIDGSTYFTTHSGGQSLQFEDANLLEEYDPIQDEWRVVQPVGGQKERMFVGGEKFYSMSPLGIYVYDFHGHLWTHLHSFSFAAVGAVDESVELWPLGILTDDHEILALVEWPRTKKSCLVQSRGLGNQNNEEIVWRKAEFAVPYKYGPCPTLMTRCISL